MLNEEQAKQSIPLTTTVEHTTDIKEKKKPLFGKKKRTVDQEKHSVPAGILTEDEKVLSAATIGELKALVLPVKQEILKQQGLQSDEWKEQDFYPLIEPFATVSILQNTETKERRYILIELPLTAEEKEHHRFIVEAMNTFSINANEIQTKGVEPVFEQKIHEIISDYRLLIPPSLNRRSCIG